MRSIFKILTIGMICTLMNSTTASNGFAIGTDSLIRKMSKEDFKSGSLMDQLKTIFEKIKCK